MRLDELLKIKIDALYKSYNKIIKSLDKKNDFFLTKFVSFVII